ncbi:MAG TPA: AAA family ATPase [Candidatus Limnocylindrales bacterium]|nr:AAA family ATPase [Candidatus Limnocylindrales bacterium]
MARRSSPVIIGRDRELREIEAVRERAAAGQPQVVIVRGEAGIGKSRLVDEVAARARAAGDRVLHGTCLDLDGDSVPYLPIVGALRGVVGLGDDPMLDPLFGQEATSERSVVSGASGADRARLFERFLSLLGELSAESPVLAVIEDAHWIDPATRDLLTFLVRNVTSERVTAILTCRTEDLPRGDPVAAWLADIGRVPAATRIELGRLRTSDVLDQLEAIAGEPVDPGTAVEIARRSDGHPLFAEELLAAEPSEVMPPSLGEILLARVASVGDGTLAVLRAAAVAGGDVDEELIVRVLDQPELAIAAALREAVDRGVVAVDPDGSHRFRHDLFREVIERELTAGERRHLHERIARALEAAPGPGGPTPATVAEIARHWHAADVPPEAYRTALAAATAAERMNAFGDAQRHLDRALAREGQLPADLAPTVDDRIALRRRAATIADLAGDLPRAEALLHEAIGLADDGMSPETRGVLHAQLGVLTWASGRGEAALREHELAVDLVPADPPTGARANVLGGLAGALMGLGRFDASRPVAEAAILAARAAGAGAEEARGRMILGSDLVALGEIDPGLDELSAAHAIVPKDRVELRVVTGHNLALNLLAADRLEEALGVATDTRRITREVGLERRYGMDLAALEADIRFRLGRWDEADAVTRAGLALDQRGRGSPYLAIVRARLAANRGAVEEAEARLGHVSIAELDPDVAVIHAVASVETALLRGETGAACELAAGALAAFSGAGIEAWALPLVAFGLRAAGDLAETASAARDADATAAAHLLADAIDGHAHAFATSAIAGTATARAWLATARAEGLRARDEPAADAWTEAVTAWDEAGGRFGGADARLRLAVARLRQAGVKADVRSLLADAWQTARELGAEPLRADVEAAARRARIPLAAETPVASEPSPEQPAPPAHAPASRHGLSPRELEVLRLVAAGRSNGEIGEELFITRKTAGVHVTHILDKLGVGNRVEAAMVAARLGLIDDVIETAGLDPEDAPSLPRTG